MRGQVVDDFAAQNSTSGGSRDTDVNELAARPTGSSPSIAVMTVMPVAKWPSTERNDAASGPITSGSLMGRAPRRSGVGREPQDHTLGRRDDLRPVGRGRALLGLQLERVDLVVAVGRIVVEQRDRLRAGLLRDVQRVVDGAVTPVPLH